MKGWVGLGWLVTYRKKMPPPGVEPGHVTHPSTNRARRGVTSLIRPTPLPLRHAATSSCIRMLNNEVAIVASGIQFRCGAFHLRVAGKTVWFLVNMCHTWAPSAAYNKANEANLLFFYFSPASSVWFCSLVLSLIQGFATLWTYFLHLSLSSVILIDSSTENCAWLREQCEAAKAMGEVCSLWRHYVIVVVYF